MTMTACRPVRVTPEWRALERFCRLHRKLACYWAQEVVSDPDQVDEAVQEAFLKATRYIQSYDVSRPIEPWIRRIVHQAAVQVRTTAQRTRAQVPLQEDVIDADYVAQDISEQVLEEIEMRERLREITEALERVLPGHRWLLAVEYGQEMPRSVIASKLGIGKTALNCRLYRARNALRELIAPPATGGER
jgi:RNA polymerase sigma factor (sigma-70 family)